MSVRFHGKRVWTVMTVVIVVGAFAAGISIAQNETAPAPQPDAAVATTPPAGDATGNQAAPAPEAGAPVATDQVAIGEQATREKVAHAKADMRMMATGIEAYFVDYNCYPEVPFVLTTPVSYLTEIPVDPFGTDKAIYGYEKKVGEKGETWTLRSIGPDGKDDKAQVEYDPSNGVSSAGDIVRVRQ